MAAAGCRDHFAINAAGFRADDLGHDDGLLIRFEHAAGHEHLGAGELADFCGAVGRDRAGQAQFLFAQNLFQFRALDGDDVAARRKDWR